MESTASTPSKRIVASMIAVNPNIRDKGLTKALKAAILDDEFDPPRFIPDAYHLDFASKVVTLIEVDDTHPIDGPKADKIGDMSLELDAFGWGLRVFVVDYAGLVRYEIPGWAFLQEFTSPAVGEKQMDYAPAAARVAIDVSRLPPLSEAEVSALADRL